MPVPSLLPPDAAYTTAELQYFSPPPNGETPYDLRYTTTEKPTNVVYERRKGSRIYDLRPLVDAGRAGETALDVTGFQVLPRDVARTEMTEGEYEDDAVIRSKYYAECERIVKSVTGCSRVIIFDHTIRRSPLPGAAPIADTPDSRLPVAKVHLDQTPAAGTARVHRHAGADAEELLKGRAQLINLWRPLRGPVLDAPLAVADARTLNPATDLVKSRLIFAPPTPEGETFQVSYSPDHRFYYLSKMQADEAFLLNCWSNRGANGLDEGARTPHTGIIDDAYVGQDVQPRHSIEVRMLLFW